MSNERPSIIVFMLDSLRPDHLGCYGNKVALTPNIDKLAENGLIFKNAYAEYPITIPTRTALMAGIYTHTNRSWKPMSPYELHVPELLSKKGYKTALFGDSPMTTEVFNCHLGFETFKHSHFGKVSLKSTKSDTSLVNLNDYYWVEPKIDEEQFGGEQLLKIEQGLFLYTRLNELSLLEEQGVRRAELVTNWALEWLDGMNQGNSPFFLWIDHFEPHEPWLSSEYYLEPFRHLMDETAGHCPMPSADASLYPPGVMKNLLAHVHATNHEVDTEVGRVIQKIEELGLTDNTIFIIISDHGEPYGEHGTIRKYGTPIHDELAKIPFIVKGAGFDKNRKIDALLTTPDISGFFLELAGMRIHKDMEALSIFPSIKDKNSSEDAIHDMIFMGAFQIRAGCRTWRWKFIDNRGDNNGVDELYDMIKDPEEKINLINEEPEIAQALRKDVWNFGKQWARQLAFRDHPLTPWTQIKISKMMGVNFPKLMKK